MRKLCFNSIKITGAAVDQSANANLTTAIRGADTTPLRAAMPLPGLSPVNTTATTGTTAASAMDNRSVASGADISTLMSLVPLSPVGTSPRRRLSSAKSASKSGAKGVNRSTSEDGMTVALLMVNQCLQELQDR